MGITWEEAEVAAHNRSEWLASECGPMHPLKCGQWAESRSNGHYLLTYTERCCGS